MADENRTDAQRLPDPDENGLPPSAELDADAPDEADAGPPRWVTEPGVSRLAPRWWLKTLAFALILIGFGAWGLYDALVAYPERGMADAEFKQLEYLRAWSSGAARADATVADPAAELTRLEDAGRRPTNTMSEVERRRLAWLRSLAKVARLDPEHTQIEQPTARLAELETSWATRTPPKPLSAYDIPAQWLFVALGFSLGPWLLVKLLMVAGKKYRWNPAGQQLTLPGGQTLTPGDLADVDKRKWDKFIVFLKDKSGVEHKVDLYHYTQPLEDWVLAMEKTAFPERAEEEAAEDEESESKED
jgi:hypothetical protein